MATLVFTVAVTSLEGFAGYAFLTKIALLTAAAAAGAYADQQFVFPALGLTPRLQDIQGDRIDDLQLSFASEGSPKNYAMGPKNRVPGTIIWLEVTEVENKVKIGSGKSSATHQTFDYVADVALGFNTGKTIQDVTDIWANGQLIMTQTNNPSVVDVGKVLSVVKQTWIVGWTFKKTGTQWGIIPIYQVVMIINSPDGGPDLTFFRTGENTTTTSFAQAANNGVFNTRRVSFLFSNSTVVSNIRSERGLFTTPNISNFRRTSGSWITDGFVVGAYAKATGFSNATTNAIWKISTVTATVLTVEDPKNRIPTENASAGKKVTKLLRATTLVLDNINVVAEPAGVVTPTLAQSIPTWNKAIFKNLTVYKGDQVAADPIIQAAEGTGNVKIWANEGYLLLEDVQLSHFNNNVPLSWAVGVEADTTIDVGTALGEILGRGGLAAARYDVTALTESLRGYFYSGPRSTLEAINPLVSTFDILAQERSGKIVFFKRGNATEVTVLVADLAAHEEGSELPASLGTITRFNPKDLPAETLVEFIDLDAVDTNGDATYEKGSVRSPRNVAAANVEVTRKVLERVVLSRAEALAIANRVQWTTAANNRRIAVQLPPSYFHVQEGDILKLPIGDGTRRILVERVARGHNYLILVVGIVEEAQTL